MIRLFLSALLLLCCCAAVYADSYTDYIDTYGDMAVEQQCAYGIPASITLAQGLLESAAGRSTLAREGNNHFGIKCHASWKGASMLRDDDAADECFRVYDSAGESFEDHSVFLTGKRYRELFSLECTDYRGWAAGLSRCGYATDPHYADRLVTIIERYSLYRFDTEAGRLTDETIEFIRQTLISSHPVCRSRGLHYVVAVPGDTYSHIAAEFSVDATQLMSYNDVDTDGEIRAWQEVYLQPKLDNAPDDIDSATIGTDEDMHSLSQRFGITLAALRALNPKAKDRPGTRLRLH